MEVKFGWNEYQVLSPNELKEWNFWRVSDMATKADLQEVETMMVELLFERRMIMADNKRIMFARCSEAKFNSLADIKRRMADNKRRMAELLSKKAARVSLEAKVATLSDFEAKKVLSEASGEVKVNKLLEVQVGLSTFPRMEEGENRGGDKVEKEKEVTDQEMVKDTMLVAEKEVTDQEMVKDTMLVENTMLIKGQEMVKDTMLVENTMLIKGIMLVEDIRLVKGDTIISSCPMFMGVKDTMLMDDICSMFLVKDIRSREGNVPPWTWIWIRMLDMSHMYFLSGLGWFESSREKNIYMYC